MIDFGQYKRSFLLRGGRFLYRDVRLSYVRSCSFSIHFCIETIIMIVMKTES